MSEFTLQNEECELCGKPLNEDDYLSSNIHCILCVEDLENQKKIKNEILYDSKILNIRSK